MGLQLKKWKLREVNKYIYIHTTGKWESVRFQSLLSQPPVFHTAFLQNMNYSMNILSLDYFNVFII